MRFPIYFFLLMSGFFYLTGNPFYSNDSETNKPGVSGKVAQLKYGRQVNTSSSAKEPEVNSVKAVVAQSAPAIVSDVAAKSTASKTPLAKPLATVARVEDPSLLSSASNPAPAQSDRVGEANTVRAGYNPKKPLDWTVFGNKHKNASLFVPARVRSQDEIDAQGIEGEAIYASRSERPVLAPDNRKLKSTKAKRRKLRAKKAARKARAKRRYARLKRKNKAAYRIARKAKKKAPRKRVAKKKRRKFGFSSTVGSGGQLVGN